MSVRMNQLNQTPLHAWHAGHGGRMVDFASWSMPVQYQSIVAEHQATRTVAGLFDVSHMGRLRFDGSGAAEFLDRLVTRRVIDQPAGRVRYALVTDDAGGILDDVLVYHLTGGAGASYCVMVVNAGNRQKIVEWIKPRLADAADVYFTDATHDWAMVAVQGPQALEIAQPLVEDRLEALKYYHARETRIAGHGGIVSRTGYTGEDGCELIVGSGMVVRICDALVAAGATPAGLGARDTLRLEAAMPLYGHELSETINPYQAGLAFAVDLEHREFSGRDALIKLKGDPNQPRRVGLELSGKRVPREGFGIVSAGRTVGQVTSGTFSPTLDRPIAMGYIEPAFAAPGTQLEIDVRGRPEPARIVELPFYRRSKKERAKNNFVRETPLPPGEDG
ncbi:MAG TPA: glycine cleavage system aminomethyltransferase GcvT [Pirellulales bacterium]|nr:glycine cleavage system aminomethyltransferase GcvT [Pirellulales bacterium]